MKKLLSGVLALVMCAGVLSGCGDKSVKQEGKTSASGDYVASEKPITLSIFQYNAKPFDNEYAIFKKAAELTNVSLEGYLAKSVTDVNQAFNLMMASGEIADIVCHTG